MTHSSLRTTLDSQHAFTVVRDVTVYAAIGRRPAQVYVDADMKAAPSGTAAQRLWDVVFEETTAKASDQIQSRPGGFFLVDREGQGRLVQLARPTPRTLDTAFSQARLALEADLDRLDELEATGVVIVAPSRRLRQPVAPAAKTLFPEDHPLVRPGRTPAETEQSAPTERVVFTLRSYADGDESLHFVCVDFAAPPSDAQISHALTAAKGAVLRGIARDEADLGHATALCDVWHLATLRGPDAFAVTNAAPTTNGLRVESHALAPYQATDAWEDAAVAAGVAYGE